MQTSGTRTPAHLKPPPPAALRCRACRPPTVARIALVKPEKARNVENMILAAAQRGAITEKARGRGGRESGAQPEAPCCSLWQPPPRRSLNTRDALP
jgi:hypothetical protein